MPKDTESKPQASRSNPIRSTQGLEKQEHPSEPELLDMAQDCDLNEYLTSESQVVFK